MWVCTCEDWHLRRPEAPDFPGVELRVVMSLLTWVLGTYEFPTRAVRDLTTDMSLQLLDTFRSSRPPLVLLNETW